MGRENHINFSTKCLPNRDALIDGYVLKTLSEAEMDMFEEHYFSCDDCFNELQIRSELKELLQTDAAQLVPQAFKKTVVSKEKIAVKEPSAATPITTSVEKEPDIVFFSNNFQKNWRYVMSAAAVVLVLVSSVFLLQPESNQSMQARLTDSILVEKYGKAFEPSPFFEGRILDNYRSDDLAFRSIAPKSKAIKSGDLVFEWKVPAKGFTTLLLTLTVYNNTETPVFTTKIQESPYTLDEKLPPGLYYWSVETASETIHRDKFLVLPETL